MFAVNGIPIQGAVCVRNGSATQEREDDCGGGGVNRWGGGGGGLGGV